MTLVVIQDGTCNHTGSVCTGPVAGTLATPTQSFVTIGSILVMVEGDTMEVPTHLNPPCTPGTPAGHSYPVNTFAQSYVTVEGNKIVLLGDSYSGDATDVDNQGSNNFVEVS